MRGGSGEGSVEREGVVWCSVVVWCGVVWCGVVWCGVLVCVGVCWCVGHGHFFLFSPYLAMQ
jgi:hypothetical protein